MGIEIERKFLLKNNTWKTLAQTAEPIQQGYLNLDPVRTVRVRIKKGKGFLTIKGKTTHTTRQEFEYEIPLNEAQELLNLCVFSIIEKTRYLVVYDNCTWEIDVFEGDNQGLEVAEIELESEDQVLKLPNWIGAEVSHEARYYNANLVTTPFKDW